MYIERSVVCVHGVALMGQGLVHIVQTSPKHNKYSPPSSLPPCRPLTHVHVTTIYRQKRGGMNTKASHVIIHSALTRALASPAPTHATKQN